MKNIFKLKNIVPNALNTMRSEKFKQMQAAEFKRDYVAFAAVILFFVILIGEIILSVAIPAYLNHKDAMALESRRLQMCKAFDFTRLMLSKRMSIPKNRDVTSEIELKMLEADMDRLARYIRENRLLLTSEEIDQLAECNRRYREIYYRHCLKNCSCPPGCRTCVATCRQKKSYCSCHVEKLKYSVENRLDTNTYLNSLIPDAGSAPAAAAAPKKEKK